MAKTMDATRKILEKNKELLTTNPLRTIRAKLDELTEQELAALKKVSDAKENQALWNYGHVIYSTLYASAYIALGAYLIAKGKEGKAFIISGTLILTNTLMSYHGGWKIVARLASCGNRNLENALDALIPIITTLMTSLLTASKLAAIPDDALPLEYRDKVKALQKLLAWINTGLTICNVYTSWVKGSAERAQIYIGAQIKIVTMKIDPLNIQNEAQTSIAERINRNLKNSIKTIFKGTAAIPVAV
jgi:hypothetical protein